MGEGLFQHYVEIFILPLYPNIGPQVVRDNGGRLLTGPVWINCDTGPGWLQASYKNVEWRSKMKDLGLHLGIGCTNATSFSQVMDDLFQTFKVYCRISTQDLFNKNIYNRMIKIRLDGSLIRQSLHCTFLIPVHKQMMDWGSKRKASLDYPR